VGRDEPRSNLRALARLYLGYPNVLVLSRGLIVLVDAVIWTEAGLNRTASISRERENTFKVGGTLHGGG
jgi:hypothetical protein